MNDRLGAAALNTNYSDLCLDALDNTACLRTISTKYGFGITSNVEILLYSIFRSNACSCSTEEGH